MLENYKNIRIRRLFCVRFLFGLVFEKSNFAQKEIWDFLKIADVAGD